ncbi:MAG TPA: 4-hydroxybenzoate 3-monooxygenase [Rhizomicrobium sp.]|nr:4-hydroxybenzoate 3-monooxygenase [Rhizomicrobium sp.]
MRTQVAIIGAGPAGLFLAHLLRRAGVVATVLERRDRSYVERRVRAGVLEQITMDVLAGLALDGRLRAQGLVHEGVNLVGGGKMFRIDMAARSGGRRVVIYSQQEVMHDLFEAAAAQNMPVIFDAADVALHDVAGAPFVTWRKDGREERLDCDFIAGCDGSHGISRSAIPEGVRQEFERVYPFGWLGILADVPPAHHELIYANHDRGFALASMRSKSRSRYYVQCGLDEKIENWPDERFWDEVTLRLGPDAHVTRGPSIEKSITPLRSFVTEPMRYGKLFLLGDAAHIVPPTGAKGLNLAVSDAAMLSQALADFYRTGKTGGLDGYSARALARVWKAERFSWWFTGLTHRFAEADAFSRKIQVAELAYLRQSEALQTAFSESYVGLPLDVGAP